MIWVLLWKLCTACEYLFEFTECFQDSMAVIVSPKDCISTNEYIVQGLSCSFICSEGEYLSFNVSTQSLTCLQCEGFAMEICVNVKKTIMGLIVKTNKKMKKKAVLECLFCLWCC